MNKIWVPEWPYLVSSLSLPPEMLHWDLNYGRVWKKCELCLCKTSVALEMSNGKNTECSGDYSMYTSIPKNILPKQEIHGARWEEERTITWHSDGNNEGDTSSPSPSRCLKKYKGEKHVRFLPGWGDSVRLGWAKGLEQWESWCPLCLLTLDRSEEGINFWENF